MEVIWSRSGEGQSAHPSPTGQNRPRCQGLLATGRRPARPGRRPTSIT